MGFFSFGNDDKKDRIMIRIEELNQELREIDREKDRLNRKMWSLKGEGYDGGDPLEMDDVNSEFVAYLRKEEGIAYEIKKLENLL